MIDRKTALGLAQLADLVLEDRLAKLRCAAAARAQTAAQIAALVETPAEGLDPVVAAQQSLRYQRWADVRRQDLNLVLARQTAAWLSAHQAASHAFGRAEVTRTLALPKKR